MNIRTFAFTCIAASFLMIPSAKAGKNGFKPHIECGGVNAMGTKAYDDCMDRKGGRISKGQRYDDTVKRTDKKLKGFLAAVKASNGNFNNSKNRCPAGKSHYRTKGIFGLGARDIGCLSPYEAESLRRQNAQEILNTLNQQDFQSTPNQQRSMNCTTRFIGRTAYTDCY